MSLLHKIQSKLFETWNKYFPTVGELSVASFYIAVGSGIILAVPYDIYHPFQSLQIILISNDSAVFFRNVHYWSGQLFLIFTLWHIYEHLYMGSEKEVRSGIWLRLVFLTPVILYVMLSGFILKADSEGILAFQIFGGLIETIPYLGMVFKFALLGSDPDLQIVYVHHVATATIFILLLIIEHTRRIWTQWLPFTYILSLSVLLGVFFPASLYTDSDIIIKGPWYFLGLQEILHWTSNPILIVWVGFVLLIVLYLLPKVSRIPAKIIKYGYLLLFFFYALLTIVGWLFRGENWKFIYPF